MKVSGMPKLSIKEQKLVKDAQSESVHVLLACVDRLQGEGSQRVNA